MEKFSFENLEVWNLAVNFCSSVIAVMEKADGCRRHFRLIEQVESCFASVAANIAEGKGRYSKKEFSRFLYISRGSLFETVTFLNIFYQNKWINLEQYCSLRKQAVFLGKKISSLILSIKRTMSDEL